VVKQGVSRGMTVLRPFNSTETRSAKGADKGTILEIPFNPIQNTSWETKTTKI
jgi:hypothetical protein